MGTHTPVITISHPDDTEIEKLGIRDWPIWTKEVSEFEWFYDREEICLLLEGEVQVDTAQGTWNFKQGDLVTFSKGLHCTWKITVPVRKHYTFRD